ncbi:MAG: ChrR family anti-sigma-E factor [Hyphomicrobiales bacterium]
MINHHPGDDMLMSYAAGSLPAGFSLLVAAHASLCARCQGRIREAEAVGGALLHEAEPVAVSSDALARVMQRIADEPHGPAEDVAPKKFEAIPNPDVPAPLRALLPGSFDEMPWRMLAPGVKQIVLPLGDGGTTKTRLLKLAPGTVTPAHSHKGQECTMVLRGSFSDKLGRYGPGDVQEADGEVHHQPAADLGEDCICLTVTDAPLRFDSLLGRMLQPLLGY